MNSDQIEGTWKQVKGKMREKWGKLTDNDWEQVAGKKDQLLGKLQEQTEGVPIGADGVRTRLALTHQALGEEVLQQHGQRG